MFTKAPDIPSPVNNFPPCHHLIRQFRFSLLAYQRCGPLPKISIPFDSGDPGPPRDLAIFHELLFNIGTPFHHLAKK
jgi:hypothetical protein